MEIRTPGVRQMISKGFRFFCLFQRDQTALWLRSEESVLSRAQNLLESVPPDRDQTS
ncbi:hypothetical protein YC2023_081335 [Brassica napus]